MASDVELQLRESLQDLKWFSLAMDESTDAGDTAQLCIFIKGVNENFDVIEEFLDLVPMKGTTTGEDIFNAVFENIASNGLKWENLVAITTDGARAMQGANKGFVGRLKTKLKDIVEFEVLHCLIHQEVLCAKSANMKTVMDRVIKVTNYIRANALHHRQFKAFLQSIEEEHYDIPYHCDVRWLSRGKVLQRFFELLTPIIHFLKEKQQSTDDMESPRFVQDLSFLSDIVGHLNDLNVRLQGKQSLVTEMWELICAFKMKLRFWCECLNNGDVRHFPTLEGINMKGERPLQEYSDILQHLQEEFNRRFKDVEKLHHFSVFETPLSIDIHTISDAGIQMELIDLKCTRRLVEKFDNSSSVSLIQFYKELDPSKFRHLRKNAAKIIAMFGSTYVCEQSFSVMKRLKNQYREQLTDANLRSSIRICLSRNIKPNIQKIVDNRS